MCSDHDYAPYKSSWKIKMKDSSRSLSKMTVSSKQSTRGGIHMVQSFLMPALELKHYGELLHWHDEKNKIFAIRWQHKRGNQWTDKDAAVFVGWDQMKGRHGDASSSEYLVEAKQRFRNALRKIHNIKRISTHDRNYRLYQIVNDRDSEVIDIAKALLSLRQGVNHKCFDQSTQTEKPKVRKKRKVPLKDEISNDSTEAASCILPHQSSDSDSGTEDMEDEVVEMTNVKREPNFVLKQEPAEVEEASVTNVETNEQVFSDSVNYSQPQALCLPSPLQVVETTIQQRIVPAVPTTHTTEGSQVSYGILNHLPHLKTKFTFIPTSTIHLVPIQQPIRQAQPVPVQQPIKQEIPF